MKHFKRNGFTKEQMPGVRDAAVASHHSSLESKGFACPVCGKKTIGLRHGVYVHPGGNNFRKETIYCKPKT